MGALQNYRENDNHKYVGLCEFCLQGWFEFVMELDTGKISIVCDECDTCFENPVNWLKGENPHLYRGRRTVRPTDDEVNQLGWGKYVLCSDVADALGQLCGLTQENCNTSTLYKVLSAIGNNHGGTYYPITMSALNTIIIIARQGTSEVSRNCAINILFDLYTCFEADAGNNKEICKQELEKFVKENIESFAQEIVSQSESDRNKKLLQELCEYIQETIRKKQCTNGKL